MTEEVETIVNYVKNKSDSKIVLIDAKAGTGKSYTSRKIIETLNPSSGIYTAFNKAIVEEGKKLLPSSIQAVTFHAMAYRYVRPTKKIEEFSYTDITEDLEYEQKQLIIKLLNDFFRSKFLNVQDFISAQKYDYVEYIKKALFLDEKGISDSEITKTLFKYSFIVQKYLNLMSEGKIAPTFDFLLKWFHYALVYHPEDFKKELDIFVLDEIQDVTGVMLEIFKLYPAKIKIGLGDQNQAIYDFLNLVNGFDLLDNTITFSLTKSFRCHTEIATKVEKFCQTYLSNDFKYEGIPNPKADGKFAYITSTNATIIRHIIELQKENKGYTLTRPLKEIFAPVLALIAANSGKQVYDKRYKFLEIEYKKYTKLRYNRKTMDSFYKYLLKNINIDEIKMSVKLLLYFIKNNINVFNVLETAKKTKKDNNYVIGTAFSLKGLGFETVYIANDLNNLVEMVIKNYHKTGILTQEDIVILRLYYVACTRAKCDLQNATKLDDFEILYK